MMPMSFKTYSFLSFSLSMYTKSSRRKRESSWISLLEFVKGLVHQKKFHLVPIYSSAQVVKDNYRQFRSSVEQTRRFLCECWSHWHSNYYGCHFFPQHSSVFLTLCSTEKRKTRRFWTSGEWVNYDRILHFVWTICLRGRNYA